METTSEIVGVIRQLTNSPGIETIEVKGKISKEEMNKHLDTTSEIDELATKTPIEISTGNTKNVEPKTRGYYKAQLKMIYLNMSDHNLLASILGGTDDTNEELVKIRLVLESILGELRERKQWNNANPIP